MAKLNLPFSVKVGAIVYQVQIVERLVDDRKLDGRVQHGPSRIQLEVDLGDQSKVQTLLHELVHIVAIQMGYPDLAETVVDAIAYSVYQVLRDNPDLLKAIAKKEVA